MVVDDVRWLDDDEQQAWRRLIEVVLRLPGVLEQQLQRDSGIGHFDYWVLALLSEAPDRTMQLKDLAAQASSSPSRLSHGVRRLEERGWVRRVPSDADGRVTDAVLTDAGRDVVQRAAPGHVAVVREAVFAHLDDGDVTDLARVCASVIDSMDRLGDGR